MKSFDCGCRFRRSNRFVISGFDCDVVVMACWRTETWVGWLALAEVARHVAGDRLFECGRRRLYKEFEVTLVTTFFQGAVYLIMMLLANAFYSSGYFVDKWFNATNEEPFRVWLFNFGYWFSILLPFTIPLIIVIQYFTVYRKWYYRRRLNNLIADELLRV